MAIRKNAEDIMARTQAATIFADAMDDLGIEAESQAEAAHDLLNRVADTVEFEYGMSTDPNKNKVHMRRVVITGAWEVDPNKHGVAGQQSQAAE